MAMNIYYTAKDIEEMAAQGIRQLEIGPGVFLTDFGRETAQQLGITLVAGGQRPAAPVAPAAPPAPRGPAAASDKYNKPSGCQHPPRAAATANPRAAVPNAQPVDDADPNTVNKLIDLMGKVIKRG